MQVLFYYFTFFNFVLGIELFIMPKLSSILFIKNFNWDRLGTCLSFGCIIHCFTIPIFILFFPFFTDEAKEFQLFEYGIVISAGLVATFAFLRGYIWHHHNIKVLLFFIIGFTCFFYR